MNRPPADSNHLLKWQVFGGFAKGGWIRAGYAFDIPAFRMVDRGMAWTAIGTFIQHNEVIAYYFGSEFLVSFFIFPTAGPEAAFYIDEASLVEVFLCQLGQTAPEDHCMPFRLRDEFSRPVFKRLSSSEGEFCNGDISFQVLYVGVLSQITY
jgi:hypothetical protein